MSARRAPERAWSVGYGLHVVVLPLAILVGIWAVAAILASLLLMWAVDTWSEK